MLTLGSWPTYCPLQSWVESKHCVCCQSHRWQPSGAHIPWTAGDHSLHSLTMQKDWGEIYVRKKCPLGRLRHANKYDKETKISEIILQRAFSNTNIDLSKIITLYLLQNKKPLRRICCLVFTENTNSGCKDSLCYEDSAGQWRKDLCSSAQFTSSRSLPVCDTCTHASLKKCKKDKKNLTFHAI